jgi:hypothetical protein
VLFRNCFGLVDGTYVAVIDVNDVFGEKFAVHELLSGPAALSVQVPPPVKVTVPVGTIFVPAASTSLTVALHEIGWPTTTEAGVHDETAVLEARTPMIIAAPLVVAPAA